MQTHSLSSRQVLTYYLQTLNNAENQQIRYSSKWVKYDYSMRFKNFLTEQKDRAEDHHTALKALENILGIYLSGTVCEPVQGLLREVEKVNQLSEKDADLMEPVAAQLLQCLKHYELVTYQAALILARNLEETRVASTLTEIVEYKEQAYLQLQNFVVSRRQNEKVMADKEAAE